MTIPEAVGLVLVAAIQGNASLCVLDMGESLNIDRFARQMIALSGLIPDHDIEIVYTGLRPGEKIYEELFTDGEEHIPSNHQRIHVVKSDDNLPELDVLVSDVRVVVAKEDSAAAAALLKKYVDGYVHTPNC